MHFNTIRKTKLQNFYHWKYEIKGKLHGNMLILKEAGNPMKYYGKKKEKKKKERKYYKTDKAVVVQCVLHFMSL